MLRVVRDNEEPSDSELGASEFSKPQVLEPSYSYDRRPSIFWVSSATLRSGAAVAVRCLSSFACAADSSAARRSRAT
jgi:hypothetical protein